MFQACRHLAQRPGHPAPQRPIWRRTRLADESARAAPNGGDGRVHVLGRWSHSVSTQGRGVLVCPTSCAEADRRQRDVHHGDELGRPKRAQRSRRFEPGIVVCHPGGGSPVWGGSRWGGASFPFKNTRFSGSHLCPSWYRSPVRPSSSPRCSSQVGRSLRLCLAASVMGLACPGRWRVAGFAMGFLALEGVWCAVSFFSLCKAFRGSGQPERGGSSDSSRVSTRSGAGRAAKG
jgi:hypothetical protein